MIGRVHEHRARTPSWSRLVVGRLWAQHQQPRTGFALVVDPEQFRISLSVIMILARRCTSRVVAFTGLILFAVLAVVPTQASVAITEFMAATEFSLPDEDGEPSDWIEITNSGADDLSLVASVPSPIHAVSKGPDLRLSFLTLRAHRRPPTRPETHPALGSSKVG